MLLRDIEIYPQNANQGSDCFPFFSSDQCCCKSDMNLHNRDLSFDPLKRGVFGRASEQSAELLRSTERLGNDVCKVINLRVSKNYTKRAKLPGPASSNGLAFSFSTTEVEHTVHTHILNFQPSRLVREHKASSTTTPLRSRVDSRVVRRLLTRRITTYGPIRSAGSANDLPPRMNHRYCNDSPADVGLETEKTRGRIWSEMEKRIRISEPVASLVSVAHSQIFLENRQSCLP